LSIFIVVTSSTDIEKTSQIINVARFQIAANPLSLHNRHGYRNKAIGPMSPIKQNRFQGRTTAE